MKTPEELAKIYADKKCSGHAVYGEGLYAGFLAGYKAGREMSEKEIFDLYVELRKQYGEKKPNAKPLIEKFKFTYIERKGFF
jgi:hypothetical protein